MTTVRCDQRINQMMADDHLEDCCCREKTEQARAAFKRPVKG